MAECLSGGGLLRSTVPAEGKLARLHPNGALDSSFSPIIDGPVYAVVVQRDGRILIGRFFRKPLTA